jgi:hypothetical protein
MRRLLPPVAAVAALVAATSAFGASSRTALTPTFRVKPLVVRGEQAHLAAEVGTPARPCGIAVFKRSPYVRMRPRLVNRWGLGLYPKRPSDGRVAWTWIVGTSTQLGRWWIHVSCGRAISFRTSFKVIR